jgi:AraC-like DNA-binding protein
VRDLASLGCFEAQRACEQIDASIETGVSLDEIALRAGFSSQSHFTSHFREAVGTTPRGFRARGPGAAARVIERSAR